MPSVTDRQERVPFFDQSALSCARGVMIGAGGIGSEICEGLVRKGVGSLIVLDDDVVDPSNLNRQFFFKRDLFKPKAHRLVRNLACHGSCGTQLKGYALSFQDALALSIDLTADFLVCGVDNNPTRIDVCRYCLEARIPVVFIAVDYEAENGYVFVQEPGSACFACAFPKSLQGHKAPCRTPAVKDILKVVAGIALYAIDSLLMGRKRGWNYRNIHLAGFAPSNVLPIERRPDCPVCGLRHNAGPIKEK